MDLYSAVLTHNSTIRTNLVTCVGVNHKETGNTEVRGDGSKGLPLRQGAVGGVEPGTDPLVAELFVAFGAGQVASWREGGSKETAIKDVRNHHQVTLRGRPLPSSRFWRLQ